jgi:hypothetical protein
MAIKSSVENYQITIEDSVYIVKSAGPNKYAVFDDFGGKLGGFVVRGNAIEPEDYGVAGAHPILRIAKRWAEANRSTATKAGAAPNSTMVCRISTHDRPTETDLRRARAHRAWLKSQPGFKAAYLAQDPATGKTLAITLWASREQLAALEARALPEGAVPLKPLSTETLQLLEEP